MMLLLLIVPAWLLVIAFVVLLCRMSARSDRETEQAAGMRPFGVLDGIVLWEKLTEPIAAERTGEPTHQGARSGRVRVLG